MAKISANYEVVFIMDGRLPEEQVAALTEKFKTLVEQNSTAKKRRDYKKTRHTVGFDVERKAYEMHQRCTPPR